MGNKNVLSSPPQSTVRLYPVKELFLLLISVRG